MKKLLSILLSALLLCALLVTAVVPDATFSDMENRVLSTFPAPSVQTVFDGSWMSDMETWLADQFPGRTFFVRTKATLSYLLGDREIGGAYIGKNNQMYEIFAQNYDAAQLNKNAQVLSVFAEKCPGSVYFLPVYSAFSYYPENLPAFTETPDEKDILAQLNLPERVQVVDTFEELYAPRNEGIYFKTDHHWTQDGAYLAYAQLAQAMGETPLSGLEKLASGQPFYGSLYSKAPLWTVQPDDMFVYDISGEVTVTYDRETQTHSLYTMDALEKKDQYTAFLDGNHAIVDIASDAGTGKTLLVFKDSFAHALVPLLTRQYDHIVMIDLRYYNLPVSQLLQENPDADVLLTYNLSWLTQDKNIVKLKY